MRTLIYGGGAVGLGLASCLLKAGQQVDIIARPATVDSLRDEGLFRTGIFGDFHARPDSFHVCARLTDRSHGAPDFVLVCTKSFDSPKVAADLARDTKLPTANTPLLLCQNGWGNAEHFLDAFPHNVVFHARIITGFRRPRPNTVEITVHADAVRLGSLYGVDPVALKPIRDALATGDLPSELTETIERDLWAKLLYNCALNPLGAVLQVPYGALAEQEPSRRIMEAIVREAYEVMARTGRRTHWETPQEFLGAFYGQMVPATANHRSSTLQDLEAGKRTEIDALNGAVIRLAEEHRVSVPVNRTIYDVLKCLETRRLARHR